MNKSPVKWLFEKDTFEENLQSLFYTADSLGIEYKIHNYRPFDRTKEALRALFKADDCVVVYGSIQLCTAVNSFCPWIPGTYCTFPNYECIAYYPKFQGYLLNENYVMLPFGDLLRRKDFLYQTVGEDRCVFIRPNSGKKTFTGKVVEKENFEWQVDRFGFYDMLPSDLVIIASPQNIRCEWRLLIVNKQVVASSQYKPDHKRDCPDYILNFGNHLAKMYEPDKCWFLDVCLLNNGELRIVEIGSFSCAGMYACDPVSILSAVSSQAFLDWELTKA